MVANRAFLKQPKPPIGTIIPDDDSILGLLTQPKTTIVTIVSNEAAVWAYFKPLIGSIIPNEGNKSDQK